MRKAAALIAAFALGGIGTAVAALHFRLDEQNLLAARSQQLFGVGKLLAA
jgi:hypothetical protein